LPDLPCASGHDLTQQSEGHAVKVIIPLAGKGTRLRPHTYVHPKPLVPVAGRPVMSYILDDLQKLGVEDAVFITGYLGDRIEDFIAREYPGIRAEYVEQAVQNGTAGAVHLAEPFVDSDVLIMFVDTLFDADLSIIHDLPDDIAGVIWAKEVEDYQRFGVIVTDGEGNMKRIVEKPKDPISKLANIGLYYIRDWKLLFRGIRDTVGGPKAPGEEFYLTDAFQYMIDHGAKIRVIEVDGWYDCGKVDTLLETNRHLLETGRSRKPDGGHNTHITEPVRIEEGVRLENARIGPNVTIASGTVIRDSTIRDTMIGSNSSVVGCTLHDSIIGDRVRIDGVEGQVSLADDSEIVK
jgi:glucose-1-phosphate thymidylyltransferase